MKRLLILLPLFAIPSPRAARADPAPVDLVVYGGTPAGIAAAVVAAREGLAVRVLEPTPWIGGMVAGGLSRTDVGREETVGGFAREFFTAAAAAKPGTPMWYAEPHVNLATFRAMAEEAGVEVVAGRSLAAVEMEGSRIVSIVASDGVVHRGKVFVDAGYEGDLMAAAGVSWRAGREARAEFGEALAGFHPMPIRPRTAAIMESLSPSLGGDGPSYIHGTPAPLSGRGADGKPVFGVFPDPGLEAGAADHRVQAYNFRLCVTRRPGILVPFPRPANYDPSRYELLARLVEAFPGVRFGRLFHLGEIAAGKYDLNAQGLFSTDHPGANFDYPGGDAATREAIRQDHVDFIQGLLWFLGHDGRVPARLRAETAAWGLCRDEFADNGHWPYALYVREARRMVGEYVMTQRDVQSEVFKEDGVAMGSFVIDCHIVQRILAADGTVRDEGSFQDAPALPYQIPYRSLVPKRGECDNLLVPVCLSASHVACCSLRMEPVYMNLGHAAGLAAAAAAREGRGVREIDVAALRARLLGQKAVLELPSLARLPRSSKLPGLVMDDLAAEKTGTWTGSGYGAPVDGFAIHDANQEKGRLAVAYRIPVPESARYAVGLSYVAAPNRASNVPVTVRHAGGESVVAVDQRKPPAGGALFLPIGVYEFAKEAPAEILVGNGGTDGIVGADAVQLLRAP